LGYAVDSSATPQRLGILGSSPFRSSWTFYPRCPHYIRPGLLEVPTSTFLVPANSAAFRIFRRLSLVFVRLLLLETLLLNNRVVTLQFHPDEFNPRSEQSRPCRRLTFGDFVLRKQGGFGFKHHLKEMNYARISATTQACLRLVARHRCLTLAEIAQGITAGGSRVTPLVQRGAKHTIATGTGVAFAPIPTV
jgi:hypothetical protein